jgi:hypothetical protein
MNTLIVNRIKHSWSNKSTVLKDDRGHVKAVMSSNIGQPRYGQKTIIINCWVYNLDWSEVEKPQNNYIKKQKQHD